LIREGRQLREQQQRAPQHKIQGNRSVPKLVNLAQHTPGLRNWVANQFYPPGQRAKFFLKPWTGTHQPTIKTIENIGFIFVPDRCGQDQKKNKKVLAAVKITPLCAIVAGP
jgi:hypothetical protein